MKGRSRVGQAADAMGVGSGLALWFTGLPGSGKSTLSRAVAGQLDACDRRIVTILDGDIVRQFLSRGVGFTRMDRYDNVCRIGYAASLIVRHGGIAIVAAVSPYRDARSRARMLVEDAGGVFLEIHMDTSFTACVARDPKGYYARALAGDLDLFTGVDDPYEKPLTPDIRVCTEVEDVAGGVRHVMTTLHERHILCSAGRKTTG